MSRELFKAVAARAREWKRRFVLWGGGLCVVAVSVAARYWWPAEPASAQAPAAEVGASASKPLPASAATAPQNPQIVATVNGQQITRDDLAQQCLWHYGESVLESLLNKYMIADYCKRQKISVTQQEVKAEIDRMAERFGIPTEQWLKMLQRERGISEARYAADIIWPTLSLRKLADTRVEPTDEEVRQAYETQFGPSVKCRLIACSDPTQAQRVRALAIANPDDFGNLAKQYSEDTNSASAKGLIQPIRRHAGDPNVEQIAFSMSPGAISEVIAVGDQYVILKCESHLPARQVAMAGVEETLREAVRDKKLRLASADLLEELQQQSAVEVFLGDADKQRQHPGLAASINGRPITMQQLATECIERHGNEVVEGAIQHLLLEQACHHHNLTITQPDIDQEIARAALAMGKTLGGVDGEPDVEGWIQQVTKQQRISVDQYVHDVVWPTVVLKKLVEGQVEVTEEDLKKGYEANFGPRVRCRAIVCGQLRQAQEVWDMARKNPSAEHFGELAEQYSVEASTRALKGEVPPIQRHGAQPELEREAFELQPGELSGIIQVRDKFVILFCEGYTEAKNYEFGDVRDEIYRDVYEKKLRITMARYFGQLQDSAQIDNYLAGTSQSPEGGQPDTERSEPAVADRNGRAATERNGRAAGVNPPVSGGPR